MTRGEAGFTLVEALVALAILGVAAAGLIGAVERHVDTVGALQARAAAQWVAENEIAERIAAGDPGPSGRTVAMLDRRWTVRVSPQKRPSADPELAALSVAVAPAGEAAPLVSIDFFVDRRPAAAGAR